jgi:hypothetical protein
MRTMPAMTGKETSYMQTYNDLIEMLPIDAAPVHPGLEFFGPCLLTPGRDSNEWTVGRLCEIGWYDNDCSFRNREALGSRAARAPLQLSGTPACAPAVPCLADQKLRHRSLGILIRAVTQHLSRRRVVKRL